jgi:hypothetical protein
MKPSRAQYRRKWVAAARTLQNTNHHDPNMDNHPIVDQHPNVYLDQLIELPLNPVLPDNSDPDNSDPDNSDHRTKSASLMTFNKTTKDIKCVFTPLIY